MFWLALLTASHALQHVSLKIHRATRRAATPDLSEWADAELAFDDEYDEATFLEDLDDDATTPLPRPDAPSWVQDAVAAAGWDANAALGALTPRERDVVETRYWSPEARSQLDCANFLDISLNRVNQLEKSSKRKLEDATEARRSVVPRDDEAHVRAHAAGILEDFRERDLAQGRLILGLFERQVGYFYFRDELRLDEAALARLLSQHGRILSQRRETLERKGDTLKGALGLDERELRKLVCAQPTLLGLDEEAVGRKILWLRNATGCATARELGVACLRCPALLATSAARVLAPNLKRFRELDASGALVARLREGYPAALRASGLDATLDALRQCEVESFDVAWREPRVLALAPETVLRRAAALEGALGLQEAQALIRKRPDILLASQEKLDSVAEAFDEALGLGKANATALAIRVATAAPRVVATIAREKVAQRLAFLTEELGLSPEQAAGVARKRPQFLGLNVNATLRATCAWLAAEVINVPKVPRNLTKLAPEAREALGALVTAYPTVLGLSVSGNLEPKLAVLAEAAPGAKRARRAAAAEAVRACPALLGYSTEGRLRPRLARIKAAGLPFHSITSLALRTEAQFEAYLSDENYLSENAVKKKRGRPRIRA